MNLHRVLLILVASILATACFNRGDRPIYAQSEDLPELEVPDDLSLPNVRRTYDIPGTFLPQLAGVGDEASPPVVLSSAEAEASRSHIRFGSRGLYLEVEDEPESVWRRLSFTLNRGGMTVRRADEAERRYRFIFEHEPIEVDRGWMANLAFWQGDEFLDYSGEYEVLIEGDEGNTRVDILSGQGEVLQMDRAEFVLARLRERLG